MNEKDKHLHESMPEALATMVAHLLRQQHRQDGVVADLRDTIKQGAGDKCSWKTMAEQLRKELYSARESLATSERQHPKTLELNQEIREKLASREGLVWLWLVVPVILSAVLGLWLPVFSYFRLLYVLPAMYILLAIGASKLKKHSGIAILFVLIVNLLSTGMYLFNTKFHREDWRGLVSHIESNHTGNSVTIFAANSQMEAFDYYSNGLSRSGPDGVSGEYDTIWLMRYVQDVFDPDDRVRMNIEDLDYKRVNELDFNGIVVYQYENSN